jgi:putative addiction module CopG family antidote
LANIANLGTIYANFCHYAKMQAMTTVTMNISLTEDLKFFVDARIKARGYSSASEYMRDLIRRDQERLAEDRFKTLIGEGVAQDTLAVNRPKHSEPK